MFGKSENRDDYQNISSPIAGMGRDLPDKFFIDFHQHTRGQLIYASSGAILVMTHQGSWVVPPFRAVWIPPETQHAMRCIGNIQMRTLYLCLDNIDLLPAQCCVISITPLLRELIIAIVQMPIHQATDERNTLIMQLFLHEIKPLTVIPLHLPIPKDSRISKICESIINDPSQKYSLAKWGNLVGASERTLIRLFLEQTGLTFRQWNQQAKLMLSIQLLAKKQSITEIALQLGYESPSAFTAMFKKTLGLPPSAYFSETQLSN
jgi:AraC-like DNA-binding protein